MADDFASLPDDERRALLGVLGVDMDRLSIKDRAAFQALCEEVLALRSEAVNLNNALAEAELLADNDALCPIFNRRAFEREVRREIALAGRFRTPLSLIFIDLDNFKRVNDVFGHSAGDDVLIRISSILLDNTRETDIVGRLGGDEFGVVLSQASLGASRRKAAQLTGLIDGLMVRDESESIGEIVRIGASCGVVEWQGGQDAGQLIAVADQAMFVEKARRKSGRASFRPVSENSQNSP